MSVLEAPVCGPDDAVALVQRLVPDGDVEGMLVVGLDRAHRLCGVAVNPRHRALSFVKVWELCALRDELDACALVVAVFPPGGRSAPTQHEIDSFVDLSVRTGRVGVSLFDCIVARGHRWWSLRALNEEQSS